MAPSPNVALKISELWPVLPVAVSVQLLEDLRAIEPMSRPFSIESPSKSSATSARLPAAIRSARAISIGSPESDNPIKTRWEKQADRSAANDGTRAPHSEDADRDHDGFGDGDSGVRELTGTASDFD